VHEGIIGGVPINAEEGDVNPAQAAAADGTTTTVRKHYLFGGQRIALWTNQANLTPFRYLHADHLGSTVMETCSGGAKCHMRGYHAFGGVRGVPGGDAYLATDHAFTGQKVDGSGLYYYNARYYDPVIGQFVSPDTIVPEPGRVFGYNRYMYVMGNPLRYNDPSGHCASKAELGDDPAPDWDNDADCWTAVDGILHSAWDADPEYWEARFTSKDVFYHWVAATPSNDGDFFNSMRNEFNALQEAQQQEAAALMAQYQEQNPSMPQTRIRAADQVVINAINCSNDFPMDCANAASDLSLGIAGGGAIVCAAVTGGGCLAVAGGASTVIGGTGTLVTVANYLNGERGVTGVDAAVSIGTTGLGWRYGTRAKGGIGAAIAYLQRRYDTWVAER
jgi:RHS repeat-associated protein